MKKRYLVVTFILITELVIAGIGLAAEKPKETASEFYKGKNITFTVPWSAGGGFDAWARLIAPFLGKYTGATVVVRNMPGGGGIVGLNYTYGVSKTDGLSPCIVDASDLVMRELVGGQEGIKYEIAKFNWLARITYDTHQVSVRKDFPNLTLEGIQKASVVKFGATDRSASACFAPLALGVALDLKNLKEVTGYPGPAEMRLAVLRGELDLMGGSIPSSIQLIRSGDIVPLVSLSSQRHKDIPKALTIYEIAPKMPPESKKLVDRFVNVLEAGRGILIGPGVPEDRVRFLTDAIAKCLKDPELVSKAEKADRGDVLYLPGNQYLSEVKNCISTTPDERKNFRFILYQKY